MSKLFSASSRTQETNGLPQVRGGAVPMAGVEVGSAGTPVSTAAPNLVTSGFDNAAGRKNSGSQVPASCACWIHAVCL